MRRNFEELGGTTKVSGSNRLKYIRQFDYQQLLTLRSLNSNPRLYLQMNVAIINTLYSVIIRLRVSAKN